MSKSKDKGRRISRRFSIAADFENIRAANSISQKQQRISKNNPNLEHDPIKRQGSWKRTKASAANGRTDDYRNAKEQTGSYRFECRKNRFILSNIRKMKKNHGFESKLNDEDFWKKVCEEKTTLRESQQRNSTSFNRGYYQ